MLRRHGAMPMPPVQNPDSDLAGGTVSQFSVVIQKEITNGPYAYSIIKDGVGQKAAINQASISAALDAVKADIGGLLAGETVDRVTMSVLSS
jgi:hypothetical protein